MQRELRLYLWDMIAAGEDVKRFLKGISETQYRSDDLVRAGVERKFEVLGEALTQARALYPELKERIADHREIVAFRNRVIHAYFAVDDSLVYSTAQDFLPPFLEQVRAILATMPE